MSDASALASLPRGLGIDVSSAQRIGGGSINRAWRCKAGAGQLFIKLNGARCHEMFAAEAMGLEELAGGPGPRVPRVIGHGVADAHAWLALEYLELRAGDAAGARVLGTRLAELHSRHARRFGWRRDNTIGLTAQGNQRDDDWPRFFAQRRLQPQLDLARSNGAATLARKGGRLCGRLNIFFAGRRFVPCLVHGDLWGGNWGMAGEEPVVFDPAVYYADPETDIAMTELFGGFPAAFYAAYRERMPEHEGDAPRRELYRLYHVLNHFNLFGGGYAAQAEAIIARLLASSA